MGDSEAQEVRGQMAFNDGFDAVPVLRREAMTYSVAILDISKEAYWEIRRKLRDAGYSHCFHEDIIDMSGIAVRIEAQPGVKDNCSCQYDFSVRPLFLWRDPLCEFSEAECPRLKAQRAKHPDKFPKPCPGHKQDSGAKPGVRFSGVESSTVFHRSRAECPKPRKVRINKKSFLRP